MNAQLTKTPVLEQEPSDRKNNFDEVCYGYDEQSAIQEAHRCLNCPHKPCSAACPVGVDIPEFIRFVALGDFEAAYDVISRTNCLPSVCGRVCPQESQCESKCVRGIKGESVSIGRLERFVSDNHSKKKQTPIKPNGIKIAVVGSGPSGLACAGDLAKAGFSVDVFEALHVAGGVLSYGIPEFRLPKHIVRSEVENLKSLGVNVCCDVVIGKTLTVAELLETHSAVYVATGAGLPKFMNIQGENLCGVFSANEYLTRVNLMQAYRKDSPTPLMRAKNVCVVGGGNVAIDAARCALRTGANVKIVYRRGEEELPARREEVVHAKEEGVELTLLTNPVRVLGDDWVKGIECVKMELGEPDSSGRRRPQEVKDSNFVIDCDCVIMALGTTPNPLVKNTTDGLKTQSWGGIIVDEKGETSLCNVYAGGDAVTGAATVILAMGAGKTAAKAIVEKFSA